MELFLKNKSDALRTFLSLVGVSVGIFVVTVSFSLVDAFSHSVVAGFDHFGSDMIMVERFPVTGGGDWSRYAARPQPRWEDYMALSGTSAGWTAFAAEAQADIVCDGKMLRDCKLLGVSGAWQHLVYSRVSRGRDFSAAELSGAGSKVIIGSKVAQELFGQDNACGRTVRIDGRNMTVTGVLSYEGKNVINLYATDYALVVPCEGREAAMENARRTLRASRGLRASQEDNFALNTMEDLCRETVSLTRKISAGGLAIALFSLLIGGFGIVNIMLVSVKERTFIIGLKKALGAKRRRILLEFMLEAVSLSLMGAALGLLLAWGALALIPSGVLTVRLSAANAILGFAMAVVLGLASGVLPAAQASRQDPVVALRGQERSDQRCV